MRNPTGSVAFRGVLLALLWGMASCVDILGSEQEQGPTIYVDHDALVLAPGDTVRLEAWGWRDYTALREPLPGARFTNLSPSILTVHSDGRVLARVPGTGVVEAQFGDAADTVVVAVRDPDYVPQTRWRSVDAGAGTVCATDQDGRAYCWGEGYWGNLGSGARRWFTKTHAPVPVATSSTVVDVSVGASHVCALTAGADALCWGDNGVGQLGVGYDSAPEARPQRVDLEDVLQVVAGRGYSCALNTSGRRYCWGSNGDGALGLDEGRYVHRPTAGDESTRFVEISTSTNGWHTCARTSEDFAYCWGGNSAGQTGVGAGAPSEILAPEPVDGDHRFAVLTAGRTHTCGIARDATTYCWGFEGSLILGRDTTGNILTPTPVASELPFVHVNADRHICGITADGAAYCWGHNAYGELGSPEPEPGPATPVLVSADLAFEQIDAGEFVTCGITTDQALYCWGSNRHGQLGGGTRVGRSHEPVRVADPVKVR